MIQFKDFTIKTLENRSPLRAPEFELLEETMLRLNAWIEENEITVLNIETLLMPNIFSGGEQRTSTRGAYRELVNHDTWWYQIFRVWYQ